MQHENGFSDEVLVLFEFEALCRRSCATIIAFSKARKKGKFSTETMPRNIRRSIYISKTFCARGLDQIMVGTEKISMTLNEWRTEYEKATRILERCIICRYDNVLLALFVFEEFGKLVLLIKKFIELVKKESLEGSFFY